MWMSQDLLSLNVILLKYFHQFLEQYWLRSAKYQLLHCGTCVFNVTEIPASLSIMVAPQLVLDPWLEWNELSYW